MNSEGSRCVEGYRAIFAVAPTRVETTYHLGQILLVTVTVTVVCTVVAMHFSAKLYCVHV